MSIKDDLTEVIIGSAFEVHNVLGSGFLEKVYENALQHELVRRGLKVQQQAPLSVRYKEKSVGEYFVDLLVEDKVICELKAVSLPTKQHEAQLVNYLTATGVDTGLLINFSDSVIVKRKYRLAR
ncbi:GxxExxY protein [Sulfuriflexus sp.]|uniref:GxxExxY protein n=1 Tax=Sulfuriflexus sp. TaxID=2015443 RepID=UPI0028CD954B|nr:GxxExxY protein [Sulfuriflexus sp.]MDT8404913.1 GxxExxY protein [Sulfuriflexus sp.]